MPLFGYNNFLKLKNRKMQYRWLDINKQVAAWIAAYARNNDIKTLVIGVSGGVDSAVVSYLCALSGMQVIVVSMPIHQPAASLERANSHITWLKGHFPNVQSMVFDLSNSFELFNSTLIRGSGHKNDLCSANTRARLRMSTLYHVATDNQGIVVGTGNKIEDFIVGFYTKYGDGGVDISPVAGFMKSEVREMGKAGQLLPTLYNAVASDDLWADGRSDEQQIGATYDEIEWAAKFLDKHGAIDKICKREFSIGNFIATFEALSFQTLSEREKQVLTIVVDRNRKNKHKMVPIPVFDFKSVLDRRDAGLQHWLSRVHDNRIPN